MNHRQIADLRFRLCWQMGASLGRCDEVDGAEYRRLLDLWHQLGRPTPILRFIADHANRPPSSPGNGQG